MKHVLLAGALVLTLVPAPAWTRSDVRAAGPDSDRGTEEVVRAADDRRLSRVGLTPCGVNTPRFTSVSPISVKRLMDMRVTNPLGEDIGHITDMIVDDKGCITEVVIRVGGFMGIGGDRVTMPLEKLRIRSGNDSSNLEAIVLETRDHILRNYGRRNPGKSRD